MLEVLSIGVGNQASIAYEPGLMSYMCTCVCVCEEDNHSETLWANIDAACYRNNGQTCRDNAMPWCSPRTLYSRCVCLCLYSRSCESLYVYMRRASVRTYVRMHIIIAGMRSLDRRTYRCT